MNILVSVLVVIAFLVLTTAGALRGVRASLLAMIGTFLGVLLVDLWQEPWGEWVRTQFRPENPAFFTWLLSTAIFFVVVLVAGLGSGVFLPEAKTAPKPKPTMRDRLAGGGIGLLNGALVSSYLLYFAESGLNERDFQQLISSLPFLGVLYAWLPWFMLVLVLTTTVFILLRGAMRLSRNTRKPTPMVAETTAPPSQNTTGQPASAQRQAAINKLNDKINNALENRK
jgi:uncharacterized membrane protein required for colicin V production